MKRIDCPHIGLRPAGEFIYGGVWRPMPEPDATSDVDWAHYVFDRDSLPAVKRELWYHVPSASWLVAERDTLNDRFLSTVSLAELVAAGEGEDA